MMTPDSLDAWRAVLQDASLERLIEYIRSLEKKTTAERALKAREKFSAVSPANMRLALETVAAREQLADQQPWSARGYFLQNRVEQSTRPEIASYHAKSFAGLNVLEICTGIGFDTAALCKSAKFVTTIDGDPLSCAIAEYNLALQGLDNFEVRALSLDNFLSQATLDNFDGIWADPGRRTEHGERVYSPDEYQPPLNSLLSIPFTKLTGIKISPALNIRDLDSRWAQEFIGWEWNCPEQVLWGNSNKPRISATRVDKAATWGSEREIISAVDPSLLAVGNFLIEPHPALVRTGMVGHFYGENALALVDEHLAFGAAADRAKMSPWYRQFEIIETLRYSEKSLKEKLSALKWDSRTQIKKRAVNEDPDEVHRALKLPTPQEGTDWGFVILARLERTPVAILAKRVNDDA